MSALRGCDLHGEWVEDGTTDDCPECLVEQWRTWWFLHDETGEIIHVSVGTIIEPIRGFRDYVVLRGDELARTAALS